MKEIKLNELLKLAEAHPDLNTIDLFELELKSKPLLRKLLKDMEKKK